MKISKLSSHQKLLIKSSSTVLFCLLTIQAVWSQCTTITQQGVFNPNDDVLISSYHQSIARTTTGYVTWGEDMAADGSNALVLTEITPANGYNYTGQPIHFTVSGNSNGQGFLATTDNLYAWGGVGEVVDGDFASAAAFGPMIGLPFNASDIINLHASSDVLFVLLNSGEIWVATTGVTAPNGNDSTNGDIWQQVQTSSGVPLTGAVQMTGNKAAGYALMGNGDIYAWGDNMELGDGAGVVDLDFATLMTATPVAVTYISAIFSDNDDPGVLALGADEKLYGVGYNTAGEIITSGTGVIDTWTAIQDGSGSDLTGVLYMATSHTSEEWSGAAIITSGATATDPNIIYTWGSNNTSSIGQGVTDATIADPTIPPTFTVGTDDPTAVSVGGHATTFFNRANGGSICFVGHVTDGSTGGLTSGDGSSLECVIPTTVELCAVGATSIFANDDTGNTIIEGVGGTPVANVLVNDQLFGSTPTTTEVGITQISTSDPGVTLDIATGAVNVTNAVTPGTYTLEYQICEIANGTNCANAIVTVIVIGDPCDAITADGIQDTNTPSHQWKIELYQGYFGVQNAPVAPFNEPQDHVAGDNALGTPILAEEAYSDVAAGPFSYSDTNIPISDDPFDSGIFDSQADITPGGLDPALANGGWQMIFTRIATSNTTITIGTAGSYFDDHAELFVNGVLIDDIIGFTSSLNASDVITYTTSPGENIEIRLTNRGGLGGFDLSISSPSLDINNNTIPDACEQGDVDSDGILDIADLDDDNDGILDVDEHAGNNFEGDEDGDSIPNWLDTTDDGNGGDGSTTDYTDTNGDTIPDVYDTDLDGRANHIDLDADNDGIPDTIEAQPTDSYNAPGAIDPITGIPAIGADTDGIDTLENSDTDSTPDFLDLDSDNDGLRDILEAGYGSNDTDNDGRTNNPVGANGYDDTLNNGDDYSDPDGPVDDPTTDLPNNADNNTVEVDYREITQVLDSDGDSIPDHVDLDDDNDGIPDNIECASPNTVGNTDNSSGTLATQLAFIEWSDDFADGIDLNDQITQVLSDGTQITLTVIAANPDAKAFVPNAISTFPGALLQGAYDDADDNYALYVQDPDRGSELDVTFQVTGTTISGATFNPTIIFTDSESTDNGETNSALTNGSAWTLVEQVGYIGSGPTISGLGTNQVILEDTNLGVPLVQSNNVSQLTLRTTDVTNGPPSGLQAMIFGFLTQPDMDNDGIANCIDIDSDNDGITDATEAGGIDADGDGEIDGFTDANDDGLDDATAATPLALPNSDGNTNDGPDYLDIDADDDGLPDNIEAQPTVGYIAPTGTSAQNGLDTAYTTGFVPEDTDGDLIPDYLDSDSDNDGIDDLTEGGRGTFEGTDTDGDGLDDGFEGTDSNDSNDVNDEIDDPTALPDTQVPGGDVDYRQGLDSDGDGVLDDTEVADGTDPNDPCDYEIASITEPQGEPYLSADCDGDGVTNGQEITDGTNPEDPCDFDIANVTLDTSGDYLISDCDGDGVTNGTEITDGTDLTDPCDFLEPSVTLERSGDYLTADCDDDTITNGQEITDGTNPADPCSSIGGTPPAGVACDIIFESDLVQPGINDGVFRITNIESYPNNTVQIYNRWGVLVFETNAYDNTGNAFRGFSNGRATIQQNEALPVGVYFYILNYVNSGENKTKNGYLYVNR